MDRKVTITNDQGQSVVADVLTAFKVDGFDSEYIIYTFNQKENDGNIKTYVSKVRTENNETYFDAIEDENEWEKVKEAISNLGKDGDQ